jgi:hypothetical protein
MKFLKTILVLFLLLGQSSLTFAGQIFITDLEDGSGALPISGNQSYTGQLGDDFTVNNDISITSIGVFDDDGDGTIGALIWELFNVGSGASMGSQTISATGSRTPGSTIESNYIWADLVSSIMLSAGETYSAVAYGFDSLDKNFNTNIGTGSISFNTADITGGGGRYGGAIGTLPGASGSFNFGAANFKYSAVPEPSILALFGAGLLGLGFVRRRKLRES